ncbi:TrbI/VirB10 family protein [Dyella sp.]|uniref:TrbI/VirB10 family protein n=1 Tax=Dyella sp. TaxID=1869338 RepID=UPI002ED606E2
MSSNHPHEPGHEQAALDAASPEHGNLYQPIPEPEAPESAQAPEEIDLDAGAPRFQPMDSRRLNPRAMMFLGSTVLLAVIIAFFMKDMLFGLRKAPAKANDETLSVADAPRMTAPGTAPMPAHEEPTPAQVLAHAPPMPPALDTRAMPEPLPMQEARGPSLLERRMESSNAGLSAGAPAAMSQGPMLPGMPGLAQGQAATSAQPLNQPDTLMLRGTYIRCVLETRIVTDIPGFTSCLVTEPVYSFTGRRLLLPKGSKVLGKYDAGPVGDRAAVIWDRIVTPTGIDVNMASPGIDKLGGAGHPGRLDNHWGSRIGAAMLISMLSDAFKYQGAKYGPKTSAVGNGFAVQSPYESNTAQTLQSLSQQAVRQAANRAPTVTLHQGTVVNIYVAKDVDFSGVVARF